MQSFEIRVSVFEDGYEDVTHMFGQASGLAGMMDCFNQVVNSSVGANCRIELLYNGRIVVAFEASADVMEQITNDEYANGGYDGVQN